jgi:hypothetical protein
MARLIGTTLGGWLLVCATACAQSSGANITLQLPSFHQFGVDTTVIAPDGGSASLAGDRAAAVDSRRWNSLGPQRAAGIARQSVQTSVKAQIHDPQQAEAALHAAAARNASGRTASVWNGGSPTAARIASDGSPASVAELSRRRDEQQLAGDRQARELFEKGRQAQQAGKPALASNYYRTSARQASPALRREIERHSRTLGVATTEARGR